MTVVIDIKYCEKDDPNVENFLPKQVTQMYAKSFDSLETQYNKKKSLGNLINKWISSMSFSSQTDTQPDVDLPFIVVGIIVWYSQCFAWSHYERQQRKQLIHTHEDGKKVKHLFKTKEMGYKDISLQC